MRTDSLWRNSACSSRQDLIVPLKPGVSTRDGVVALLQHFQSQAGTSTGNHISSQHPHLPDRQHDFLRSTPAPCAGQLLRSMSRKGLPSAGQMAEDHAADPRRLHNIKSKHLWLGLFTV